MLRVTFPIFSVNYHVHRDAQTKHYFLSVIDHILAETFRILAEIYHVYRDEQTKHHLLTVIEHMLTALSDMSHPYSNMPYVCSEISCIQS